jgi:hypothetical protein
MEEKREDRLAGKREDRRTEASGSESLWLGEDDRAVALGRGKRERPKDQTARSKSLTG